MSELAPTIIDEVVHAGYRSLAVDVPAAGIEFMGFDSSPLEYAWHAYPDASPVPHLQPPAFTQPFENPEQRLKYPPAQPAYPMDAVGSSGEDENKLPFRADGIYEAPGQNHEFVAGAMAVADTLGGPDTLGEGVTPSLDAGIYMAPGESYELISSALDIADGFFDSGGIFEGFDVLDIIGDN